MSGRFIPLGGMDTGHNFATTTALENSEQSVSLTMEPVKKASKDLSMDMAVMSIITR